MASDVYSKKSNNVSNLLRFVDSFYMKFLVVLISLIVPAGITMTKVFGVEKFSKMGVFIFIIAATFLTLLWTKLDFKVTPSLFSSHMPWRVKKKALARRGILLFIMGHMDDLNNSQFQQFTEWAMNESLKAVTPFDHGMHDSMNSGMDNHFNGF